MRVGDAIDMRVQTFKMSRLLVRYVIILQCTEHSQWLETSGRNDDDKTRVLTNIGWQTHTLT